MDQVKAVLLVGGMGTRLRPVLPSMPKALAPVGEKPFLELLVRQLRSQGIGQLVMCTGHLGGQIEREFGDGRTWDVSIEYSKEETPLGTAGAIKLAQRDLRECREFLVLNGDSFLGINFHDFLAFHRRQEDAVVTMAVVRVEDASQYGTVQVSENGRVTGFSEKTANHTSGLVNGGVYVFSHAGWPGIPEGPASLERDVFPRFLGRGMYAKEEHGVFIDIGTPADYARAQQLLRFA